MKNFEYTAPQSLRAAVATLAAAGKAARVLAGGTDLIVQMRGKRFQPDCVVDIKNIPEVNELSYGPRRGLVIGAAVPCHRIYTDAEIVARYAGLVDAAAIIGGIQIQGRATFGGNVCNASPSADSTPALIAYGATCQILGPEGKRSVPLQDFSTGPGENVLQDGELLVALHVPPPRKNSGVHYLRFIPRNEMDIAVVGAGAAAELVNRRKQFKDVQIVLAAVGPTPIVAREAAEWLVGREVSDEVIAQASKVAKAAARPISDMRGTAEYRTHLVGVLTKRALQGAVARARGEFVANAVQEAAG